MFRQQNTSKMCFPLIADENTMAMIKIETIVPNKARNINTKFITPFNTDESINNIMQDIIEFMNEEKMDAFSYSVRDKHSNNTELLQVHVQLLKFENK